MTLSQITQYGTSFGVTDLTQDGYAPGQLVSVAIEANGTITARFEQRDDGRRHGAAGDLPQPAGPAADGRQQLGRDHGAGTAMQGNPGEQNRGVLQSGALEDSNVDLTAELVSMMTAQRMYQANAQTIKTEDAVLQTLVNLR